MPHIHTVRTCRIYVTTKRRQKINNSCAHCCTLRCSWSDNGSNTYLNNILDISMFCSVNGRDSLLISVPGRRNYREWERARRRSRVPLREASMLRKTHALCENSTFWLVGGRVMKVTATSSICIWVRQQLEKRRIHSHWRSTPVFSSTQERLSTGIIWLCGQ